MLLKISLLIRSIILCFLLLCSGLVFGNSKVSLCSDTSFWYPFTLVKQDKAVGIHIDIITQALNNLGYGAEFTPLPWKRCLQGVKQGQYDGVATASYKQERETYLHYPADAANALKSQYRVMLVQYVVVTLQEQDFHFNGDPLKIPQPVRAPHGYSIVEDLKKFGLDVDDASYGDKNNFRKLLRYQSGSVVAIPEVARALSKQLDHDNKLRISDKSFKAKSYYLPFSRKSKLSEAEREKIWQQIALVRDNGSLMTEFANKY